MALLDHPTSRFHQGSETAVDARIDPGRRSPIVAWLAAALLLATLFVGPTAAGAASGRDNAGGSLDPHHQLALPRGLSTADLPTNEPCSTGLFSSVTANGSYLSVTLTKWGRFTARVAPAYVAARLASCYGTVAGGTETDVWGWIADLSAEVWLHAVAYPENCALLGSAATCTNLRQRANPVDINFESYATLPIPDRYLQ